MDDSATLWEVAPGAKRDAARVGWTVGPQLAAFAPAYVDRMRLALAFFVTTFIAVTIAVILIAASQGAFDSHERF